MFYLISISKLSNTTLEIFQMIYYLIDRSAILSNILKSFFNLTITLVYIKKIQYLSNFGMLPIIYFFSS